MSPTQFLGVAAATVLLIVVPGPSVVFIVGQALARGRAAALLSAAGNAVGASMAGMLIALGLGVLITRSAVIVEVMRYAGAGVLVVLGVVAIATAGTSDGAKAPSPITPHRSGIRSFFAALVVGLTNPKVYIIFAALLPAFVDASSSVPVPMQMAALAMVPVVLGLITDATWAMGASWARASVVNAPSRMRLFRRIGGGCLVAVGGYTALHRG
ncbi:LysE family translocator [uncultured Microbacterium sp.]|uniref:LysE family translocator n=1 Tax=uncultured Microbacterium sp. TaxID=191216 RepID=UPI0025D92EBD|nr:LysE family translocator [uncultured Microbacterium sp.]